MIKQLTLADRCMGADGLQLHKQCKKGWTVDPNLLACKVGVAIMSHHDTFLHNFH